MNTIERLLSVFVLAGLMLVPAAVSAESTTVTTVTVTDVEGEDYDDAVNRAVQKAVEQAAASGGVSKPSQSALVRETAVATVADQIKTYEVIKKTAGATGAHFVSLKVAVDMEVVRAAWSDVDTLLQEMGQPKIMVFFAERIFDHSTGHNSIQKADVVDDDSQMQVMIEQLLADTGFKLVFKNQVEAIQQKKAEQAAFDDDMATLQAIAAEHGADMFISGKANVSGPQVKRVHNAMTLYMWETDITLRGYWTETAQILFAAGTPEQLKRGGSRLPGRPGAKQALQNTGKKLAKVCKEKLVKTWTRQAVAGSEVVLEVHNCATFGQMMAILKGIKTVPDIDQINRSYKNNIATFRLQTRLPAQTVAEKLYEVEFSGVNVEIQDLQRSTIKATASPPGT